MPPKVTEKQKPPNHNPKQKTKTMKIKAGINEVDIKIKATQMSKKRRAGYLKDKQNSQTPAQTNREDTS